MTQPPSAIPSSPSETPNPSIQSKKSNEESNLESSKKEKKDHKLEKQVTTGWQLELPSHLVEVNSNPISDTFLNSNLSKVKDMEIKNPKVIQNLDSVAASVRNENNKDIEKEQSESTTGIDKTSESVIWIPVERTKQIEIERSKLPVFTEEQRIIEAIKQY